MLADVGGDVNVDTLEGFEVGITAGCQCAAQGTELRVCAEKSFCVSADVCAAYDPNFPEVSDKRNNAALNFGLGITKYTGSRGKSGASDASAEERDEDVKEPEEIPEK